MNCMEGIGRRFTLSEQTSILDSSSINLRDLLKVRDDVDEDGRNALAGLTLGAVLGCEEIIRSNPFQQQQQQQPSRTLLDIIKDEESGTDYREIIENNNKQKPWKSFKDILRIRRAGAVWSSSSSSHPVSDYDLDNCRMVISNPSLTGIRRNSFTIPSQTSTATITTTLNTPESSVSTTVLPVQNGSNFDEEERENSTTTGEENNITVSSSSSDVITVPISTTRDSQPVVIRLSAALAAEREEQRQLAPSEERERTTTIVEEVTEEQGVHHHQNEREGISSTGQPLRVSLMALLEETTDHRQIDMIMVEEDEDEDGGGEQVVVAVEREEGGGERRNEEYMCCVCMVRHKGAAFIPCGHTFCRICSRKLWVNRGNCPLCNGFILEILDIF